MACSYLFDVFKREFTVAFPSAILAATAFRAAQ